MGNQLIFALDRATADVRGSRRRIAHPYSAPTRRLGTASPERRHERASGILQWMEDFNPDIPDFDRQYRHLVDIPDWLADHSAFKTNVPQFAEIVGALKSHATRYEHGETPRMQRGSVESPGFTSESICWTTGITKRSWP